MNPDKKPENPSAFPALHLNGHEGMTLRDYFAAKAMQAFTTKYGTCLIKYDDRAKESYKLADVMLKQREL